MSLLFNILSRWIIGFLPEIKHLLISWLQSTSAVIVEPKKIKSDTVSPSICHEVMGIEKGVRIVITTQVPHEGSDMGVYQVGLRIKQKYEIPEAYDMTTEAVVAKVMWALPQSTTAAEFAKLFYTPIGNDIV